ncbi:MAG TPA: FAD-binding protein [Polyangiaceae bacterium]|nr:FAD-binding protein [Polyangiaceae bacterium]
MDRRSALKTLALGGLSASPFGAVGCRPPPPITTPGDRTFEHPESEDDLVRLVNKARRLGLQLRVRGSLHSVSSAIFTDDRPGNINVQLDRYQKIIGWDEAKKQVTVQAGAHLGVDPQDPASSRENSFLWALHRHGWALPDLGGITHQTVGGFLSTGSMGGTIAYDVGEAIVCLRIVAGDGNVYELHADPGNPRDEEENPFYGAGVAMGLYGIISTVTFQCVDRYDVIGKQVTTSFSRCAVDLFGDKDGGLRKWSEEQTYNRVLLWPQQGVEKVQLWSARRTTAEDAPRTRARGGFVAKPFSQVPEALQSLAYLVYKHVDRTPPPYAPDTAALLRETINAFITDGTEEFWDHWLETLPMDNQVSDNYLPTEFTELFVDISETAPVMKALSELWAGDARMERTGPFATEVYPAKKSRFWMSPSSGRNSFRVDVFWFKSGKTDPDVALYPKYWELLRSFGFRFHWGKHLSSPDSSTGVSYRRAQNPNWDRFLAFRRTFDPDQIFVTDYWRAALGIPKKA